MTLEELNQEKIKPIFNKEKKMLEMSYSETDSQAKTSLTRISSHVVYYLD